MCHTLEGIEKYFNKLSEWHLSNTQNSVDLFFHMHFYCSRLFVSLALSRALSRPLPLFSPFCSHSLIFSCLISLFHLVIGEESSKLKRTLKSLTNLNCNDENVVLNSNWMCWKLWRMSGQTYRMGILSRWKVSQKRIKRNIISMQMHKIDEIYPSFHLCHQFDFQLVGNTNSPLQMCLTDN